MRIGRRGFALIVVLLAIGAVFALALRSAVVARTTVVEADAMSLRATALRDGRSAVVMVLRGLVAQDEDVLLSGAVANGGLGGDGSSGSLGGAGADEEEEGGVPPGLPPELVELLGLETVEEEQDELLSERSRRLAEAARAQGLNSSGVSARQTIDALGLPGEAVSVSLGGRVYRVTLGDAAAALNANRADERMLRAYFAALDLSDRDARKLADEWLDWIDEDNVSRTYGAEQRVYGRDGIVARNGPIAAIEELRVLPSMTPGVFEHVRRDWAVSTLSAVHAGSASEAVLACLEGASEDWARSIVEARDEAPLTAERLRALLPRGGRLGELVTVRSSGVLRVRVDVTGETTGSTLARLEGAAVLTKRGVSAVELLVVD